MKHIPGYEQLYAADKEGNIYRLPRKTNPKLRKLKLRIWKKRRSVSVTLCKDGIPKTMLVRRLVALTFIPNPENKTIVYHADGDYMNNHISNLRWGTYSESIKCAWDNGLYENSRRDTKLRNPNLFNKRVRCINTEMEFESVSLAAKWCKTSTSQISLSCRLLAKSAGKHPETGEKLAWAYI